NGPFFRLERMSLLSPHISLFVHPLSWRPRASSENISICDAVSWGFSARGSSTCSMTWKGRTMLQTSPDFPFQTSSTSRLSSNSRKRYFSGNGLSASIKRMISCCSCSVSRGISFLFLSVVYPVVRPEGHYRKYITTSLAACRLVRLVGTSHVRRE